ncbi:MAG TPA: hypothetical protein VE781_16295 [Kineosporiaceae bacterium]|nr:hypothetical protein [Kineosporiaceae bacterium]
MPAAGGFAAVPPDADGVGFGAAEGDAGAEGLAAGRAEAGAGVDDDGRAAPVTVACDGSGAAVCAAGAPPQPARADTAAQQAARTGTAERRAGRRSRGDIGPRP